MATHEVPRSAGSAAPEHRKVTRIQPPHAYRGKAPPALCDDRLSPACIASPTGFESPVDGTLRHENGAIGTHPNNRIGANSDRKRPIAREPGRFETKPEPSRKLDLRGVVEPALAKALMLAAEAQRWELVAQLAAELAARRAVRTGSAVVRLKEDRDKRNSSGRS